MWWLRSRPLCVEKVVLRTNCLQTNMFAMGKIRESREATWERKTKRWVLGTYVRGGFRSPSRIRYIGRYCIYVVGISYMVGDVYLVVSTHTHWPPPHTHTHTLTTPSHTHTQYGRQWIWSGQSSQYWWIRGKKLSILLSLQFDWSICHQISGDLCEL